MQLEPKSLAKVSFLLPRFSFHKALVIPFLYAVVCVCWGTTWLGIGIAVESIPPLTSAGLRFLVAFPLFFLFAIVRGESIFFPKRLNIFFIFTTLFYFAVPYWLLNFGELYVSSGLTALLFSTMPVFILIFSALILNEKILFTQSIGMLVGFLGLMLIIRSQGLHLEHTRLLGVFCILVAAIMHALSYVLTKRYGGSISVLTFNVLPIGIAGLLLTIAGIFIEQPSLSMISERSVLATLYLGIVASVGGFITYFYLLKHMSPNVLSFVFIIFPALAVAIGAWYEGSRFGFDSLFYLILILFGFSLTKLPARSQVLKILSRKPG